MYLANLQEISTQCDCIVHLLLIYIYCILDMDFAFLVKWWVYTYFSRHTI